MSVFQYVTYITTLNKQILLNCLNYTSLDSFFYLKEEAVFDRHEVTFCPKENVSVVIKRQCVHGCIFSFQKWYISLLKKTPHCLLFFSFICYKIYKLNN